jgi:hypothetical protein
VASPKVFRNSVRLAGEIGTKVAIDSVQDYF